MSSSTPDRPGRYAGLCVAVALAVDAALVVADLRTHSVVLTATYLAVPLALARSWRGRDRSLRWRRCRSCSRR